MHFFEGYIFSHLIKCLPQIKNVIEKDLLQLELSLKNINDCTEKKTIVNEP